MPAVVGAMKRGEGPIAVMAVMGHNADSDQYYGRRSVAVTTAPKRAHRNPIIYTMQYRPHTEA